MVEKCPKCDSTSLVKSGKVIKCKGCSYFGSARDFNPPEKTDILEKFGFGDCWNCNKKHKLTELRKIPNTEEYLCNRCFKTISAIIVLVIRSLA